MKRILRGAPALGAVLAFLTQLACAQDKDPNAAFANELIAQGLFDALKTLRTKR